jgi:succinate-semialdehyde dehydrogenase/glutarate-semialdehyde dehydrogenase
MSGQPLANIQLGGRFMVVSTSKITSTNPATFESLADVSVSSPSDIKKAVESARSAQPAWQKLGIEGRLKELQKLYSYLAERREQFAQLETKEMGKPIAGSRSSFDWALRQFRWNLDNAAQCLAPETSYEDDREIHQIHYEPYGVAGVITPWNFPLSNFVMGALQPLIAGNTVVYKISEEVPLFGQALDKAWQEAHMPRGVFSQIYGAGDVGELLARSDIDLLHFTGSSAVGKKLYVIAAEKFIPVTLELGGSDAGIVFEDADVDGMIQPIFWAKFINAGQICCGLKRLFVHKTRYDEVVSKLSKFISQQKVGNPDEEDTVVGPLASEKQRKLLVGQVEDAKDKGVKVILGGKTPSGSKGAFFEPTLLTGVNKDMRAYYEELFGPVLPIAAFDSEAEAIQLANDTPYGLSAYVYTKDRERFKRVADQLEAGSISHNGLDYSRPVNPFGGYKGSGIGKTCGKIGLQHACRIKVTAQQKRTK